MPPIPDCHILIAKPAVSVSTKYVYEHLDAEGVKTHPDIDGMIAAIREGSLKGITDRMENVLETVTIPKYPVIEEIKNCMNEQGAMNALMSGSGPTVFGIFEREEDAYVAKRLIQERKLANQVYVVLPFHQNKSR